MAQYCCGSNLITSAVIMLSKFVTHSVHVISARLVSHKAMSLVHIIFLYDWTSILPVVVLTTIYYKHFKMITVKHKQEYIISSCSGGLRVIGGPGR